MDDFSMQHERQGKATVLTLTGKVDSQTAPALDAELSKLISSDKRVVISLKELTFLSSAGVRAIIQAVKTAKKARGEVKLAEVPGHTADILNTVGIMEIVQAYPTIADAVASF